jgi:hypothetical protein
MLIPLTILACLGSGIVPTSASGQSVADSCIKNTGVRANAMEQKQWGRLVSTAREFMSSCLTVDGGAEAQAHALSDMGTGLNEQGKFEDAVPILKRCVTIKPDAAYCWVELGRALERVGRPSEARKAYEQTISIGGYDEDSAASIELARVSLSHPWTSTTFRGHTLGESWQAFIRTEEGLCQIKTNTESCSQAASGEEATLSQYGKDGTVMFWFEYGRFAHATAFMSGPTFAELTYFEKTYGKPGANYSHPEKGTAESVWHFLDGGEAHAKEYKSKSDKFTIEFDIQASESTLRPGALAANPHTPLFSGRTLGESWQKFAQTGSGLCRASKDSAQACKDAAAGKDATLVKYGEDGFLEASFTFESRRLTQADLNTRVPKFVELDYLDQTYGHPYTKTNLPEMGNANRRWDYADGGQVLANEMPNAEGFLIMITARTIPPQSTRGLDTTIITVGSKSRIVGLYQQSEPNDDGASEYLRFYSDGTVIECASIGTPAQINRWFQRPYDQSGKYEIQGSTIRFSIASSDNPDYTIDFRGQVQGNMLTLEWLSYQNGRQVHDSFHLVTAGN